MRPSSPQPECFCMCSSRRKGRSDPEFRIDGHTSSILRACRYVYLSGQTVQRTTHCCFLTCRIGRQAAIEYFSERQQTVTFNPEKTIREVVGAVLRGNASLGVVPSENSTFGSVAETYDALTNPSLPGSATLAGEHVLPINHSLIVRRGVSMKDIKAVYSHPQVSNVRRSLWGI